MLVAKQQIVVAQHHRAPLGQWAGTPRTLCETGGLRRLPHVFDVAGGYRSDEAAVERREGLLNRASRGR